MKSRPIIRRNWFVRAFLPCILMAFVGCYNDPCHDPPCIRNHTLSVRGVRAADSANLFFGPHAVYPPDSIGFYALLPNDSFEMGYARSTFTYGGTDSALAINFYDLTPSAVYMRLGANDVDTLAVQYRVFEVTECCGTTYEPTSVRYNGGAEIPWTTGLFDLKK